MLKIVGYPDRYSASAGERIDFKVSLDEGHSFEARLVRVIHGDSNPEGPGLKFTHIPSNADGAHAGRTQSIDAGSYLKVDNGPLLDKPFTFFVMVWPTLVRRDDQTLLAQWDADKNAGIHIGLGAGGFVRVTLGGPAGVTTVTASKAMRERQWYALAVAVDPTSGAVQLTQRPTTAYALVDDALQESFQLSPASPQPVPLMMAGCSMIDKSVGRHFDGKLDTPILAEGLYSGDAHEIFLRKPADVLRATKVIAHWDFSKGVDSPHVHDTGPFRYDGNLVNLPTRAMKGWNWTGDEHSWARKPEHYGAIHFHSDDLYDAGWETSVTLQLPDDLKSGAYALHIRCGESDLEATREDYISFFVVPSLDPAKRGKRPKVAFLAPTCSYIAYANHAEHITVRGVEINMNRAIHFGHSDLYMYDHPELGGSLYDTHADGSGVCYSSRLRPVLNFKAQYHSWLGGHGSALYQYNADTHIFDWLDAKGIEYDIITDEDLHRHGLNLISDYSVILSGTHPEYHSTEMWDGMKAWIDRGGRLMYLGGNGWYWRVAFNDNWPGAIELRRAEDGIRPWIAEPGEYFHSFNAEYGGLWRRVGRAPNVIAGVGFVAQGFDVSTYYVRAPDAENPRAAFVFEGVDDTIIGNFGLIGGGAAGIELDCINSELGSPPNMLRLASSENHSSMMVLVNEEFGVVPVNIGGDQNLRVRADLAFGETPSGGALFATSSIAWCGSLSYNNYDNNVSRITENVLRRFMSDVPFETRLA